MIFLLTGFVELSGERERFEGSSELREGKALARAGSGLKLGKMEDAWIFVDSVCMEGGGYSGGVCFASTI